MTTMTAVIFFFFFFYFLMSLQSTWLQSRVTTPPDCQPRVITHGRCDVTIALPALLFIYGSLDVEMGDGAYGRSRCILVPSAIPARWWHNLETGVMHNIVFHPITPEMGPVWSNTGIRGSTFWFKMLGLKTFKGRVRDFWTVRSVSVWNKTCRDSNKTKKVIFFFSISVTLGTC